MRKLQQGFSNATYYGFKKILKWNTWIEFNNCCLFKSKNNLLPSVVKVFVDYVTRHTVYTEVTVQAEVPLPS